VTGEPTPEERAYMKAIDRLDQMAMAKLWRFAPSGHPYFLTGPVHDYFKSRFDLLGGMSVAVSKAIGWDG
jgi:hypothetical protein